MAEVNHTNQIPESADLYARDRGCFCDHRGAPFRFEDQIDRVKPTILSVGRDGLVHQKGLPSISLPSPEFDSELEESLRPLRPFSTDYTTTSYVKLPQFSRNGDIYLPKDYVDLGYDTRKEIDEYQCEIQSKCNPSLSDIWLPLYPIDIEKDEGLQFPSTSSRWQFLALRQLECEKIEIVCDDIDSAETTNGSELVTQLLTREDLGIQRVSHPQMSSYHLLTLPAINFVPRGGFTPFIPSIRQ